MEDTPKKPELKLVDEVVEVKSEEQTASEKVAKLAVIDGALAEEAKSSEAAEAPEKEPGHTCTCEGGCKGAEGSESAPAGKTVIDIDLKELQAEVEKIMDDKEAQQYAEAMVLGTQLYLWGVQCVHGLKYGPAVAGTFLEAIKASMTIDGVNPRPFSAESTLANLQEFMPAFAAKVKERAESSPSTIDDVVQALSDAQKLSKEEGNADAPAADVPEDTDTQEPTEEKGE